MFWGILIVLAGLVAFPEAVARAASDAALLWWTRVVPVLTPYLILTGLALRANPGGLRIGHLHPYATGSLLLGALGGYPVGARVLGQGLDTGALTPAQAQRFSYASGLMSPAFLLSVTAIGLFGSRAAMLPLCASVYGVTFLVFFLFCRVPGKDSPPPPRRLSADDVSTAISGGMSAILRIAGCMLLCACLGALLEAIRLPWALARAFAVREATVSAVLAGLLEMTGGCRAAAALPLPLAVRLALCVFFQMFGGASVLLQTRCFLKIPSFLRYIGMRFCMALAAALLCFMLCRLLPDHAVETIATLREALQRAEVLFELLLPCGFGLLLVTYLAVLARPVPNLRRKDDKRSDL